MKGAAQRRSRRYRPGEMKAQTWYRIQGEEMNTAQRMGSFTQMVLKASIGVICTSSGGYPSVSSAPLAGRETMVHRGLANVRLTANATATPIRHLINRERSSSRCSRNDMRNMPSSSSSPPLPPLPDGGGGVRLPPAAAGTGRFPPSPLDIVEAAAAVSEDVPPAGGVVLPVCSSDESI